MKQTNKQINKQDMYIVYGYNEPVLIGCEYWVSVHPVSVHAPTLIL